jgi:hypothetical protein
MRIFRVQPPQLAEPPHQAARACGLVAHNVERQDTWANGSKIFDEHPFGRSSAEHRMLWTGRHKIRGKACTAF